MDNQKLDNGFHKESILVREFTADDRPDVLEIFSEGLMEMVADTAFRGLRHHPESVLLYTAATALCFVVTMCWWVIALLPATVMCLRYFYSRCVIGAYLREAMNSDMGDIEGYYMSTPGSCLWVAVLKDKVVGVVAAAGQSGGALELRRMCVDRGYRRCGVGIALGQTVLKFAAARGYSSVVLGTTAYAPAAHQLYHGLGFRRVRRTNGYATPGATQSLLERIFYRVHHHYYTIDLQSRKNISSGDC
ncbi:hypothetical protein OJAV_G00069910 [Oryzias javanicus]|uniref:N-acetylaspartate synthetase n=1 Tax=Oryzias javanicus TaxID=123683 RepID=A0A3S2PVQ5_ORYJA|nr:hypothetical protein OJAV_G00069910 [Oryzias javanicus]